MILWGLVLRATYSPFADDAWRLIMDSLSNTKEGTVQPPPAVIDDRRRPHGNLVAGTGIGSLPHFRHDVSRFRQVQFGVDFRDSSGAMA